MFTMLVSIFTYLAFLFVWFACAAAIGVYLYFNSKKFRMNTVFWVIIGLVFNVFGLCAYFIARNKVCREHCPVCFAKTEEWAAFCPVCDAKLENARPKMKFVTKLFIGICSAIAAFSIIDYIFTALYSA